jgi:eukaryotic-like serine/threonine-protein kinase
MASRGFSRIEELYHAALGHPPGERIAFLQQACAGDEGLLREVKSLLGYEAEAERLFEQPVSEAATRKLAILRGTRFGPYEVLDWIGSGGMGEVYRARDTRLGREVAIKVLPEEAAGDAGRLRRFEREARSAAALNHPNIATVYEVGDHEGTRFIAMELVEGQTLKDRLEAARLSMKELLDFASQIARGLAKAHESGIVHRDLKPGNLMVTSDGLVKILDFGLARRTPHASDVGSGLTREGMVLGTVQYMSPEQAAARPHDHRSDQFSFGAILYEMATGRRAFERDTTPQTLAAIIEDEPEPLRTLNAEVPAGLSSIVERCLAKDPDRRFASTAELVRELALVSAPAIPAPLGRPTRRLAAIGLALVAVIAAFAVSRFTSRPAAPQRLGKPLEAVPFTTYPGHEAEPTFSPDGAQVAFTWDGESQDNHDIYVKAIGAEQPLRLTSDPGRDGSPAWSPDGTRIAFLRDKPGGGSEMRLIPPTGGPERRLGEVQGLAHQGLSWSPDGRSLAVVDRSSPGERVGIFVLDIVSGVKKRLIPSSTFSDILPAFSPDGRTLAFNRTLLPRGPFVHVVPVAGGEPRELAPTSFPRGRLAWMPGGEEILFAAVPLARDGGQRTPSSYGRAGASLWRVPADGGEARLLAGSENAGDVALSADGHRLVYSQGTIDWDIWRLDLRRGPATEEAQTRFAPSTKIDANPQISPDGERVAFTSIRSGQPEIWVVDGQGRHPLRLTSFEGKGSVGAPRWSPDGKTIAFDADPSPENNVDIYVISASGGPPRRVTTSPDIDATPSWSKDGRFIYFGSHRNSSSQVWKVPSSGEEAGRARQVTRGGGFAAIESPDGRHVYFTKKMSGTLDLQNALWRIPVEGGDEEVVVEGFRSSHGSWDLTAEGLYFVDQEPSSSGTSWVVRFQGFDRRHATEVARLRHPPFLAGPAISVSSDGRWMLSTQSQAESDLMLVETFR